MAKRKQEEAVAEAEEGGLRSRMYLHEGLAEYIEREYGVDLNSLSAPEIIAWAFSKRNEWRATDEYAALKDSHAAEAKPAKAEKATKATAKKATKATKAAPKKAAAKKATKKTASKKSEATEESPFD